MKIGITGTGRYIPEQETCNTDFLEHEFLERDGSSFQYGNDVIIEKFQKITGIGKRRYAKTNVLTSDMGVRAAEKAIEDAGIDKESIDYIIFAHNFGDLNKETAQNDMLPSLATRVKHNLKIKNPRCVAYDMIFGCPGWIEGCIQGYAFIKSGMAKKCLVIGAETLSRIVDPHDRDSMIFADGAGAAILEASSDTDSGEILNHASLTHANGEAFLIYFDQSNNPSEPVDTRYLKMHGRKVYEFACIEVPKAMAECLDASGATIDDVKKIFIHQANEKMDEAIINRFYKIYGKQAPKDVMPMSIHTLGNSSVATIPTLFDLVRKEELGNHKLDKGDVILFASVGAGMNINAIVYRY